MKTFDFIDSNIGARVYLTRDGDIGMHRELRKFMAPSTNGYMPPELFLRKRTKAGLAYLEDASGDFYTVPCRNVRLYSELEG